MSKLKITGVSLSMTADDWELYSGPHAEEVAHAINTAFETAVAEGRDRKGVSEATMEVMRKHADDGAIDSEPLWHLDKLLSEVFPPKVKSNW